MFAPTDFVRRTWPGHLRSGYACILDVFAPARLVVPKLDSWGGHNWSSLGSTISPQLQTILFNSSTFILLRESKAACSIVRTDPSASIAVTAD